MITIIEGFFASVGALLAFGSFSFYLAAALVSGLIVWALAYEKGTRATVTLIFSVLLVLHFNTGLLDAARYMFDHVILFLLGAVAYLALGAVWSLAKWRAFHSNLMESYDEKRRKFLKDNSLQPGSTLTPELKLKWEWELKSLTWLQFDKNGQTLSLDPYDYMPTIVMWMGHWPFSVIHWFLKDPVRRILRGIFTHLVSTYEKISRSAISSIQTDLLTEAERQELATAAQATGAQADEERGRDSRRPRF